MVRRTANTFKSFLFFLLILGPSASSALASGMSDDDTFLALDQCLHIKSNRFDGTAGAWDKETFTVTRTNLSDADKLNGISAIGTVEIFLPVKRDGLDWAQGDYAFPFKIKNGTLSFEDNSGMGKGYPITSADWSCDFKNGQRLLSPVEAAVQNNPTLTSNAIHAALNREFDTISAWGPVSISQSQAQGWIGYKMPLNASVPFHQKPSANSLIVGISDAGESVLVLNLTGFSGRDWAAVQFNRNGKNVKAYVTLSALFAHS